MIRSPGLYTDGKLTAAFMERTPTNRFELDLRLSLDPAMQADIAVRYCLNSKFPRLCRYRLKTVPPRSFVLP